MSSEDREDNLCFTAKGICGLAMQSSDTVRAWDEADYRLCQRMRRLAEPSSTDKPYHGSLLLTEARVRGGNSYECVLLSMAAGYSYLRLCDISSALLKQCIAHRYRSSRLHGRREGKYRRWDMRLDAGGREALVEELERRVWAYEEERLEALQTQWDRASRSCTYFVDEPDYPTAVTHIVFSNKDALASVRLRSLLADSRAIEQPRSVLQDAVDEEKARLARFISAEHAKVIGEPETNVRRLPDSYRLLISTPVPGGSG